MRELVSRRFEEQDLMASPEPAVLLKWLDKLNSDRFQEHRLQEQRWHDITEARLAGVGWSQIALALTDRLTHKYSCDEHQLRRDFASWIEKQAEATRKEAEIAQRHAGHAAQARSALTQSTRASAVLRTLL